MIRFIAKNRLLAFHEDQLSRFGGKTGVRDKKALKKVIKEPQKYWNELEPESSLFEVAASYGHQIASRYPFRNGNKRMAVIAVYVFLYVNGFLLNADQRIFYAVLLDLVHGKAGRKELAEVLRNHSIKREE
mgnify:CR=1 FL=1